MAVEREKMCPRQMWQVINEIVQWMGLDPEAWIKIHAPTELRPGKVYITKYVSDGVGSISLFKIAEGKSPVLGQDIVFGEAIFFNENGLRHREFNPKDSGYKLEEGEHIIELNLFDFSDIAAAFTDIKEGRVHIGTYAPSALEFIKYYADRNGDPYPVFIPSSCSALNHLDLYAIENGTFPRELPPDIFFDHDDFEKWMEGMHEKLRWVDRSKPYDGVIAFPLTQNECFTSKPPSDKKQVNPMDYDTLQMHYDDIMSQARTISPVRIRIMLPVIMHWPDL